MMPAQGPALLAGGRFHEAAEAYAQAVRQQPDSAAARVGLARALAAIGDWVAAAAWLSDALRLAPDADDALQLLADLLLTRKQQAQPCRCTCGCWSAPAAARRPTCCMPGSAREHAGVLATAIALYRESLAVNPQLMEAHVDLAGVLWRVQDFEGTLAHARQAVALAPGHAYAQRILGMALLQMNRLEEAERHLRRALELQPDFALAQLDLAFALLLAGRLTEGWKLYESRWADASRSARPPFYQPEAEWPGLQAPLKGKAIAVYAEQGWGDVLQFLRYLPRLQQLAGRVCCVVQAQLVPLVEASFPGVECLAPGRELTVQVHAALLDLPGRFGTTLDDIPAQVPYVRARAGGGARALAGEARAVRRQAAHRARPVRIARAGEQREPRVSAVRVASGDGGLRRALVQPAEGRRRFLGPTPRRTPPDWST
ncbi:tetratricopeptide repeat protein [Ramlibacter terrae]|uniref:Tetratricopeptide repeat protein n=1 Tax=Ramlibacter terrae TaxID=2732511 RepID=A0ABX6P675_9BURK|nr:tetratricopeptide repeat protein [Ramlibacter terrae]